MTQALPAAAERRRTYDHRLREHVCRTGARPLDHRVRIPRSTISSWKRRGLRPVVTLAPFDEPQRDLAARIENLERRARVLAAVVRLLLALLRASGFRLTNQRLPEGAAKENLLRAIKSVEPALPLPLALRIVGLSPSRYHAWRRAAEGCRLDDRSACPRTLPAQLTPSEIASIREMVLAPEHRHMPHRTLSLYAQRIGRVFASATTWARLVRERGWRRPRLRVHPARPSLGVRAARPDELWHIDATIVRLLDGTKAYLHAVIDNFSRRMLAWTVRDRLEPAATCEVLLAAGSKLRSTGARPTVVADSGVENVNTAVDATLLAARLRRVLAQVEVTYSNSIIEAWWRSLKHQWLYLNSLDSIGRLRELVAFFVEAHNARMPHAAFRGQTPDEMYFGTATNLADELAAARKRAIKKRLADNRATSCDRCSGEPTIPPPALPAHAIPA